jgi:hypothetical protein
MTCWLRWGFERVREGVAKPLRGFIDMHSPRRMAGGMRERQQEGNARAGSTALNEGQRQP